MKSRTKTRHIYRELWIKHGDEWSCAGRLDEPAAILTGVWQHAVVPAVLIKFYENAKGGGAAECLFNDIAAEIADKEKEQMLRDICDARDTDTLLLIPPPVKARK